MSTTLPNDKALSLEQRLSLAEKEYETARMADKEFHVLKEIRETIKRLKAEIAAKEYPGFKMVPGNGNSSAPGSPATN